MPKTYIMTAIQPNLTKNKSKLVLHIVLTKQTKYVIMYVWRHEKHGKSRTD